jgi:hypothetical protein
MRARAEIGIGGPKRKDLTLDQAAEEFLAWAKANKRPRTQRTYGQCIARLQRAFTGKRLGDISAFDLERYKRERIDAGVTVMVNRELACLKSLYNRCREWGTYDGGNPRGRRAAAPGVAGPHPVPRARGGAESPGRRGRAAAHHGARGDLGGRPSHCDGSAWTSSAAC